jgi:leader peptidase (prepilin peptidase)/N-methyltransferase
VNAPAEILTVVLVTFFGLIMGSAVTALSWRLPRGRSWVKGRSGCTSCGATLTVRDLVPVFSWAFNRGRCRHCGAPVAMRYPLTELICAAWAVLLWAKLGPGWAFVPVAVWGFILITLTWIDFDFQILPDALTLPGTLIALAAVLPLPGGPRFALFGIVLAAGLLWFVGEVYYRVRGVEGMGGGDVKLAVMFGAVLGWQLSLLTILIAAATGSLWGLALIRRGEGDGRTPLPFGTLLGPAAMVAFLWGDGWVEAYARLLR